MTYIILFLLFIMGVAMYNSGYDRDERLAGLSILLLLFVGGLFGGKGLGYFILAITAIGIVGFILLLLFFRPTEKIASENEDLDKGKEATAPSVATKKINQQKADTRKISEQDIDPRHGWFPSSGEDDWPF